MHVLTTGLPVHRSIVQRKDWDGKRDDAESGGFKVQCWDVERCPASGTYPPPPPGKFNSEFTPESHGGWKTNDPFLLGFGHFSGANC